MTGSTILKLTSIILKLQEKFDNLEMGNPKLTYYDEDENFQSLDPRDLTIEAVKGILDRGSLVGITGLQFRGFGNVWEVDEHVDLIHLGTVDEVDSPQLSISHFREIGAGEAIVIPTSKVKNYGPYERAGFDIGFGSKFL